MKVLFLLKKRNSYGGYADILESGLLNSAKMTMHQLIERAHVKAELKVVIDGNGVDREIYLYKPQVVIIEAIWVTPKKLAELVSRHSNINFIIRIHSEIPFIANEGNSVLWCKEYAKLPNVYVAFNSNRTADDFTDVTGFNFFYLPNIYDHVKYRYGIMDIIYRFFPISIPKVLNIGCFGAIRPMKNQLQQAFAAIQLANKHNSLLFFHINSPRIEQGGLSVLKNLRTLFEGTPHTLVEHSWLKRDEFLSLIKEMDIGMQVSMNESFNIVTADFVKQNIPIVVSGSIDWMPNSTHVDTEDSSSIIEGMEYNLRYPLIAVQQNRWYLYKYNEKAISVWRHFFR